MFWERRYRSCRDKAVLSSASRGRYFLNSKGFKGLHYRPIGGSGNAIDLLYPILWLCFFVGIERVLHSCVGDARTRALGRIESVGLPPLAGNPSPAADCGSFGLADLLVCAA
jgi:hypothetical protein